MRNFTCSGISAFFVLALAGCPGNPPPHLVDAFHPTTDTGTTPVDTNPMGQPDMNVPAVDMGTTPGFCGFGGGCDLLATSACPPDGATRQGCYLGDTATACAPAGTATSGACASSNGCERGYACVGPTQDSTTCERVCCSATDCDPGSVCNGINDSSGAALPNHIGTCHRLTACTPLPNAGCTGTDQCNLTMSDGTTDCLPSGTTAEGGNCDSTACATGLGCYVTTMAGVDAGTPHGTCFRFCRQAMGNADCPTSGTTCVAFGPTYGLCR